MLKRQMFEDQRKVGPARAKELDVAALREDAGSELRRVSLGSFCAHVLQVRQHEVMLEPIEERLRHTIGRR